MHFWNYYRLYLEEQRYKKLLPVEILDQYKNDPNKYISFTANLKPSKDSGARYYNKLGLNPMSVYDTPIGIYSYPLKAYWHTIKGYHGIPFQKAQPIVYVFSAKNPEKVLIISKYTEETFQKDLIKLNNLFDIYLENIGKTMDDYIDAVKQSNYFNEKFPNASLFWSITRQMSRDFLNFFNTQKSPVLWTKIMMEFYDGVVDDKGAGIIHGSEPCQAVFFNKALIEENDVIFRRNEEWFEKRKKPVDYLKLFRKQKVLSPDLVNKLIIPDATLGSEYIYMLLNIGKENRIPVDLWDAVEYYNYSIKHGIFKKIKYVGRQRALDLPPSILQTVLRMISEVLDNPEQDLYNNFACISEHNPSVIPAMNKLFDNFIAVPNVTSLFKDAYITKELIEQFYPKHREKIIQLLKIRHLDKGKDISSHDKDDLMYMLNNISAKGVFDEELFNMVVMSNEHLYSVLGILYNLLAANLEVPDKIFEYCKTNDNIHFQILLETNLYHRVSTADVYSRAFKNDEVYDKLEKILVENTSFIVNTASSVYAYDLPEVFNKAIYGNEDSILNIMKQKLYVISRLGDDLTAVKKLLSNIDGYKGPTYDFLEIFLKCLVYAGETENDANRIVLKDLPYSDNLTSFDTHWMNLLAQDASSSMMDYYAEILSNPYIRFFKNNDLYSLYNYCEKIAMMPSLKGTLLTTILRNIGKDQEIYSQLNYSKLNIIKKTVELVDIDQSSYVYEDLIEPLLKRLKKDVKSSKFLNRFNLFDNDYSVGKSKILNIFKKHIYNESADDIRKLLSNMYFERNKELSVKDAFINFENNFIVIVNYDDDDDDEFRILYAFLDFIEELVAVYIPSEKIIKICVEFVENYEGLFSRLIRLCIDTDTVDLLLECVKKYAPSVVKLAVARVRSSYGEYKRIYEKIIALDAGGNSTNEILQALNNNSPVDISKFETLCQSENAVSFITYLLDDINNNSFNLELLPHIPACWTTLIDSIKDNYRAGTIFSSYGNISNYPNAPFVQDLILMYINGEKNSNGLLYTLNYITSNVWQCLYTGEKYPEVLINLLKDDTFLQNLIRTDILYKCIYFKGLKWDGTEFNNTVGYNRLVNIVVPKLISLYPSFENIISEMFNIKDEDMINIKNKMHSIPESTTFKQFFENFIDPVENTNENNIVQELNGETINQIPNPDRIFEIFEKEYLASTGHSWNKHKFMSRAADWNFYGNTNGFVTIRKQNSGFVKLVGAAGAMKSKYLGFKKIKDLNYPLWGLVSKDIAQLLIKMGGYRSPNMIEMMLLKANISKAVLGDASIKEYTKDGGIVINYPDVGVVTKYFVGSDAYYKKLYSMKHLMPK